MSEQKQKYFKSVIFGGYDKATVLERFEELNNRVIALEAELDGLKKESASSISADETEKNAEDAGEKVDF